MKELIALVVAWGPMLLLVGVWIYFMRKGGVQGQYVQHLRAYMEDHIAETRRLNANLERIASVLEAKDSHKQP